MALMFLFACSLSQLPSMACQGLKCSGKSFRVTLIGGASQILAWDATHTVVL